MCHNMSYFNLFLKKCELLNTGQFGLRLPSFPIDAESPHSSCEHSHLFRETIYNVSKIELILNKANAYFKRNALRVCLYILFFCPFPSVFSPLNGDNLMLSMLSLLFNVRGDDSFLIIFFILRCIKTNWSYWLLFSFLHLQFS